MKAAHRIGPLIPWACTVWKDGIPYGLTLYAADYAQIERDHPGVRVDGRLVGWLDA